MVNKLEEECNETVAETSLVNKINPANCKHKSCILYIVLFSIFFTFNVGIGAYFVYYKYMNHNKIIMFLNIMIMFIMYKMGKVKQIDIKNRTYYFYNHIIDLKNFDAGLLKIDKKSYKNIDAYNIGYITIKRIDDYERIYSVNPLYLRIDHVNGYIEERKKYLIFDSADKTKELLKNAMMFGMELRIKLKK